MAYVFHCCVCSPKSPPGLAAGWVLGVGVSRVPQFGGSAQAPEIHQEQSACNRRPVLSQDQLMLLNILYSSNEADLGAW